MHTLNCSVSAKIKISNFCPYWIGHPPKRSSGPHSWRTIWFRTIALLFGRTLKCKFISSDGAITAPVLISIRNLHEKYFPNYRRKYFNKLFIQIHTNLDKVPLQQFESYAHDEVPRWNPKTEYSEKIIFQMIHLIPYKLFIFLIKKSTYWI